MMTWSAWPNDQRAATEVPRNSGHPLALAGGPSVLLADEPTAEVSSAEEQDVLALLRKVRPAQGGTVLITHSAVVAATADRVVTLLDGRVQQ